MLFRLALLALTASAKPDAGACTDDADHTIWEATGKAAFESDMTTW